LVTLVHQAFRIEGYFEAYINFVDNCRRAEVEGREPELVEFNPLTTIKEGLGDEETIPLDGNVVMPDKEGDKAGAAEGSDHDEDLDA